MNVRDIRDISISASRPEYSEHKAHRISVSESTALTPHHELDINDRERNEEHEFPSNSIRTSKYTVYSFLPVNLLEQFRRIANFYFLLVVAIQLVPGVTPFPLWTSVTPLVLILAVSAFKEAYEDYLRHKEDNKANGQLSLRVLPSSDPAPNESGLKEVASADIQVGDILKIVDGEEIPADVILLSSSKPDGTCYLNTANLDGEAAPKIRRALNTTQHLQNPKQISHLGGKIQCEEPNAFLDQFRGRIIIKNETKTSLTPMEKNVPHLVNGTYALGDEHFCFRASKIVNTEYVFAAVVYTGAQTKLMLNRTRIPFKFSGFERLLNQCVLVLLVFNILLCICLGGAAIAVPEMFEPLTRPNKGHAMLFDTFTYFILFSFMIPMSLYVTMELVKIGQAKLIEWDVGMSVPNSDDPTLPLEMASVKTSDLNEELGRVDYIFSDKTGTLTRNHMELSRVSVDGMEFRNQQLENTLEMKDNEHTVDELVRQCFEEKKEDDILLADHLFRRQQFLLNILICHSVIPVIEENEHKYLSSSPDEVALVEALHSNKLQLEQRIGDKIDITYSSTNPEGKSQQMQFKIIATLDFTSDRRRMTVIVEKDDGSLIMYTKGADSAVLKLCAKSDILEETKSHLQHYAQEGSRTLLMACKEISQEQYRDWKRSYDKASTAINRRPEKIDKAFRILENDMTLLGCSAVDDQLQSGVPETVDDLLAAKIKLMVLTGDKQETAVTIGRASHILQPEFRLLYINITRTSDVTPLLEKHANSDSKEPVALVVDGFSLELCLMNNPEAFLKLFIRSATIICCRANPAQKAMVVELVKNELSGTCLAIGDGANDVSMIQEANVGIGLLGKEGTQAALSADYVLRRFRHLRRLLFIHGRYSFLRTSKLVLFSFFKNMAFLLPQFWFAFNSKFTGQALFDGLFMTFFNIVFTAAPPLLVGLLEKDAHPNSLLKHPIAYSMFKKQSIFTVQAFLHWIVSAVYFSIVSYYVIYLSWGNDIMHSNGQVAGLWAFGSVLTCSGMILLNAKMMLESLEWTYLGIFGAAIGPILFLFVFAVYQTLGDLSPEMFGMLSKLVTFPSTWFQFFLISMFTLVPGVAYTYYQRQYFATYVDVLREKCDPRNDGVCGDHFAEFVAERNTKIKPLQ